MLTIFVEMLANVPAITKLLTVLRLLLTVVILVPFATPALLPETAILLTVVRLLLTVVIFVPFATPALLPETAMLLTVFNELLIDKTAPLFGIFVKLEPSPINLA